MRVWVALVWMCAGCGLTLELEPPPDGGSVPDFGTARPDLGRPDLGASDFALPDLATEDLGGEEDDAGAGEDATVCVAIVERCNGEDDDCDGAIDEDYDFLADPAHCGGCDNVCEGRGGTPACDEGICVLTCDPGREDCDDDLSNGCETDLSAPETCGGCETSCSTDAPVCITNGEAFDCVLECAVGQAVCDGACVDLSSSASHCGACGDSCFLDPHGRVGCNGGSCVVLDCGDNHADCNDDPSDGCEQPLNTADHCGSCGVSCDGVCVSGLCTAATPGG